MAIIGIGTDIESISRFKDLPYDENQDFYDKIFTDAEKEYCLGKADPSQHFAARFCVKEAFIKAINQDIRDYRKIEIQMDGSKPKIMWDTFDVHISMAHDKDKSVATVIITEKR